MLAGRQDDVGCEACQAKRAADIGAVAGDGFGPVFEAVALARCQSITTTFPLSDSNSIVVRNPLHAFGWHEGESLFPSPY
jgi:hypothetical protein